MSSILYYSNFCENCKKLLTILSKSGIKNNIHYICIDKRINKNNSVYVVLENNQEILLPNTVKAVPALVLINKNYQVLYGEEITNFLKPVQEVEVQKATNFNGEPSAYSLTGDYSGVVSDNYSFLDQNSDELSAKGSGGMRQLYSYATIDHQDQIETPPDDYVPDKIGEVNIKNLESQRNTIS
jgi:hypothetical protein